MSIYLTQTITVWLLIPHLIRMMKAKGPTQISFFFYYSVQAQWQSHCTKTQEIKPSEKGSLSLSQALEFEELIRGRHYYYYYSVLQSVFAFWGCSPHTYFTLLLRRRFPTKLRHRHSLLPSSPSQGDPQFPCVSRFCTIPLRFSGMHSLSFKLEFV